MRIEMPDLEIGIALVKNKWKEKVKEKDVRKAEEKFKSISAKKKLLIVPNKGVLPRVPENVEVLDCRDALKLART
ncbi:hypothetical protein P8X24_09020 [Pyrococcus kukulkanii]|uniref:hypothetical protein n=1 Tax=Pyrococcus kukulkanii TaxID=1609559 RepID=UPI003567EFE3